MKKLLSLLLMYVFLSTQGWALSGGPFFGGSSSGATVGTFAGVLTPTGDDTSTADTADTGTTAITDTTDNSLGVFVVGVPTVGVASGGFVYFTEGRTYSGTIIGVADPERLSFQGLVNAQFDININSQAFINTGTGAVTSVAFSFPAGYANGSLDCEIVPGSLGGNSTGLTTRIQGDASLSVQSADVTTGAPTGPITSLDLTVDGYKQSDTSQVSADLSAFGITDALTSTGG